MKRIFKDLFLILFFQSFAPLNNLNNNKDNKLLYNLKYEMNNNDNRFENKYKNMNYFDDYEVDSYYSKNNLIQKNNLIEDVKDQKFDYLNKGSKIILTSKEENNKNDYKKIKNNFKIDSIKTSINLFKNQSSGFVRDKIFFELSKGYNYKIIRKISLSGTSEGIDNLMVSSL